MLTIHTVSTSPLREFISLALPSMAIAVFDRHFHLRNSCLDPSDHHPYPWPKLELQKAKRAKAFSFYFIVIGCKSKTRKRFLKYISYFSAWLILGFFFTFVGDSMGTGAFLSFSKKRWRLLLVTLDSHLKLFLLSVPIHWATITESPPNAYLKQKRAKES